MVQFGKCVSESRTTVPVQRFALFVGDRCYEGHWPGRRLHQHLTVDGVKGQGGGGQVQSDPWSCSGHWAGRLCVGASEEGGGEPSVPSGTESVMRSTQ